MATKKFYHDIDLVNVGQLIGARIQNVTTSEKTTLGDSLGPANKGLQVWDTELDAPFIWSGTLWLRDALEVSGDIVYKGAINPTNAASVDKVSGFQYVVDTAGTLTAAGVTFSPSGVVEVGDVVLFTDATTATVLQRNNEQATESSLGIVELATQTEVNTGTDTTRVITPATLAGSQLASDVSTNTADIATNTADIATNTADIATNTADIATNTADIATNTADIATNAADIATNTSAIGTLTSLTTTEKGSLVGAVNELDAELGTITSVAMGTNASTVSGAIAELEAEIDTNTIDIATNTADIATNTANIATNTADIATNTADIATNTADIATNTADIATNTADIATNAADIATNTSAIGTLTSLTTSEKGSLVGAVNELDTEVGTLSSLETDEKGSLVGAINEIHGLLPKTYFNSSVSLTADTAVTITHSLSLTNKDSFTIRVADTNGSTVSVDVDSVDVNSLTLTSGVSLTGIKVTIIGF